MLTAANLWRWLRSGTAGMFSCKCEGESRGESPELSLLTWVLISGREDVGEVGEQGDAEHSSIVINGLTHTHTNTILLSLSCKRKRTGSTMTKTKTSQCDTT